MTKSVDNVYPAFDKEVTERYFDLYPKLKTFICAGTVSLKVTRELLGIDRYVCWDMYLDLISAGAIYGSGSNCYRATPALKEYILETKETNNEKGN